MRKYQNQEVIELCCNQCGKKIKVESGIIKEGVYTAEIKWGYFSNKDGQMHSFDICENCYDQMIEAFAIPAEKKNVHEYL